MNKLRTSPRAKLVLAALMVLLVWAHSSTSSFAAALEPELLDSEVFIPEVSIGDSNFRLSTTSSSIPTDGKYSYTVEIAPGRALKSVNLRFELYRKDELRPFHYFNQNVIVRQSETASRGSASSPGSQNRQPSDHESEGNGANGSAKVIRQVLERKNGQGLENLGMSEGIYRVACVVTTTTDSGQEDAATLRDLLIVYDPSVGTHKVVPVLHLNALSERRADGVFARDLQAGLFEARRGLLESIATWIVNNEGAHLTLAVSPLLLEEVAVAAEGYSYVNGGSEAIPVTAEEGAAPACLRTLESLRAAVATERLTITAQGYSDPDMGALDVVGLDADVIEQYELGTEVLTQVLGVAPGNVTVPWRSSLGEKTAARLLEERPGAHIVVQSDTLNLELPRGKTTDASVLIYSVGDEGKVVLADAASSDLLTTPQVGALIRGMLDVRRQSACSVMLLECPDNDGGLAAIAKNLPYLSRYDWIQTINASDDVLEQKDVVSAGKAGFRTPQYSDVLPAGMSELVKARQQAQALAESLAEPDENAQSDIAFARALSLRAEAGSGMGLRVSEKAGSSGSKSEITAHVSELNAASLTLALAAQERCGLWFEPIAIKSQPITFSGSSGKLPITVINGTQGLLLVTVRLIPPGNPDNPFIIVDPAETVQLLRPNETFLEPSVELRNVVSGTVTVQVLAGNYVITEETVRVSATFADRIAIIVVVALAGTALTIYVWRRVKKEERTEQ